jgi:hypothetical protein
VIEGFRFRRFDEPEGGMMMASQSLFGDSQDQNTCRSIVISTLFFEIRVKLFVESATEG